jgi:phosphate transport system substrate-binding protein
MKAGGIKVLPIDGQMPSQKAVIAKTWPYARPTFYYTNGEPSGLAKTFTEFTLSPSGQKIVDRVGFVAVKEVK